MNFLSNLLVGWADKFPASNETYGWMGKIFGTISVVLYIIMGVIGAVGAIYAVWLGIQLARADSEDKRKEAKTHLIYVLIAVAVTIALVLFFNLLLPEIVGAFIGTDITKPNDKDPFPSAKAAITAVRALLRI